MKKFLKYFLIIFVGIPLVVGIIQALFSSEEETKTENKTVSEENISADNLINDSIQHVQDSIESLSKSFWSKLSLTDDLTKKKIHIAYLESEDKAYFDFPYNGGSTLTLTLRNHPQHGKDVYLEISKGQFLNSVNGTDIKVRFDDGQVMTFNAKRSKTQESNTIFIKNYSKFVSALKKSKTCIIQAPFFHEGNRTFNFKTQNLDWEY